MARGKWRRHKVPPLRLLRFAPVGMTILIEQISGRPRVRSEGWLDTPAKKKIASDFIIHGDTKLAGQGTSFMGYPLLDLTNKTAVVIGGTSGIGLTLSKVLAQAGADVVPTGRRAAEVAAAASAVRALGRRSLVQTCDVTDNESLAQLLKSVCAEFGSVQILVNSAGRTKRMPTLDVSDSDWDAIMETNLTGTLRACRVFGRHMIEKRYGRIINIASLATFVALYEVAAYSASKAAVASLTKSLAMEWAAYGVCVNAIAPGVFRTDLERRIAGRDRARERVPAAHPDEALRKA